MDFNEQVLGLRTWVLCSKVDGVDLTRGSYSDPEGL